MNRRRDRILMPALVAAFLSSASSVQAQPAAPPPLPPPVASPAEAPAPTRFEQGKALMKEEKFAEAIPRLLEAITIEKGVGALFNLGVCYEKIGKPASAYARFKEAEAVAREKSDPREIEAHARATAIEPRLSKMTISIAKKDHLGAPVDVPELEVKLDGVVIPREEWGISTPIDPGPHTVDATRPNRKPWASTFIARESGGDWTSVVIGPFTVLDDVLGPSARPDPVAPPPDKNAGLSTQQYGAIAAGGVGVVGVVLGTVFGLGASSKNSDSKAHCTNPSDPDACDATGVDLRDSARSSGTLSTVFFIVGGAGLAAGAVLWFTAPKTKSTPAVGVGPSGFTLKGTW